MTVVEKIKEAWYKWIPSWLPIVVALCWLAMQYQRTNDRLDSLEKQMQAIQEYLRNSHEKAGYLGPNSGLQLPESPVTSGVGDSGFQEK